MMKKSRLWATGLLFAVFALGLAIGGVTAAAWSDGSPRREPNRHRSYIERLDESLDLTPMQRDSIAHLVQAHRNVMDSLWSEIRPRYETSRASLRAAVMEILSDGQREIYRDLISRSDKKRENREKSRNEDK